MNLGKILRSFDFCTRYVYVNRK